ncbi:conserved protein, unknown function [Hepatocystis sp. ex Piliocolobus tephrosceles]|nr:conserved protein, unknown function [Hepatocystis sp. ex Piliocolobus tephrosceles]
MTTVDKEKNILVEKIKYNDFNNNIINKYKKIYDPKYGMDNTYMNEQTTSLSQNSNVETTTLTTSDTYNSTTYDTSTEERRKPPLHNLIHPFISLGKNMYSSLTLIYEPKLYHLSIFLTTLWACKNIKYINKLLFYKYNDLQYQITRPDSLNTRLKAFKTLAIGGSIIPLSFISLCIYDMNVKKKKDGLLIQKVHESLLEKNKSVVIPYTLRRNIALKMNSLKERTLFFAKSLAENNSFKKVSTEYYKNIEKRLR